MADTPPMGRPLLYKNVDWSLSNARLAKQLGRKVGTISTARSRYGDRHSPFRYPTTGFTEFARLGNVNWDLRNNDIARAFGMNRVAVGLSRKALKAPPPKLLARSELRREAFKAQVVVANKWYKARNVQRLNNDLTPPTVRVPKPPRYARVVTLNTLTVLQRQELQRIVNHHRAYYWRLLERMRERKWDEADDAFIAAKAAYEAAQELVVVIHTGRASPVIE